MHEPLEPNKAPLSRLFPKGRTDNPNGGYVGDDHPILDEDVRPRTPDAPTDSAPNTPLT